MNPAHTLGDAWGAEISPSGYELVIAQQADAVAPGIVDIAQSLRTGTETLADAIARAMTTVSMAQHQRDLLQVQLERARQGLPPITTGTYGQQQGIDPKLLILALAGIALFLALRQR